jgi:hypothetical protein
VKRAALVFLVAAGLIGLLARDAQVVAQFHALKDSTAPIAEAAAITPHDTNLLANTCRAVYVGGAGSIVADMELTGTTITFAGATAGSVLPIRVIRVKTASTATLLLCLY